MDKIQITILDIGRDNRVERRKRKDRTLPDGKGRRTDE